MGKKGNERRERGAIVVEATISLTAFIFLLYTILSVLNICYIQAKMSTALNTAAKQISQYCYLYYKLGGGRVNDELAGAAEKPRKTVEATFDGISSFMTKMSDGVESGINGDYAGSLKNAIDAGQGAAGIIDMYAEQIANDPKGFIIGMGMLAACETKDYAFGKLCGALGKAFMAKNLKDFKDDDPDQFLKRYMIKNGLDDLDFKYTALMPAKNKNLVLLVVTYDVHVIRLLNIDYKFTFRQVAETQTWGEGAK